MANPRHTIHVGITVLGVIVGAILAVVSGGDPTALMLASGGITGISYWVGAHAHRKHG